MTPLRYREHLGATQKAGEGGIAVSEPFNAMDHAVDLGMHPNREKPQYVQAVLKFVCPHGCGFEELSSCYISMSYWEGAAKWHVEEECPFREPPTADALLGQAVRLLNDASFHLTSEEVRKRLWPLHHRIRAFLADAKRGDSRAVLPDVEVKPRG